MSSPGGKFDGVHQDAFHRIVRTLSGRTVSASPTLVPSELSTPLQSAASPEAGSSSSVLQRIPSLGSVSSQTQTKKKLSIGERLKKLSKDLGKSSKSKSRKSLGKSPVSSSEADTTPSASAEITPIASPAIRSAHAKLLSMVAEGEESESLTEAAASPNEPPEPTTLAKKIQALIDSLPIPTPGQSRPLPIVKKPKPPARESDGRPIPPPGASPIKDSRLIAFLSSATIMNGSTLRGRPSIWSILESIGAPVHDVPAGDENAPREGDGEANHEGDEGGDQDIFSDNSSVMVYSPLIPGQEDLVELAELVPVSFEEYVMSESESVAGTSWTAVWPLSMWYGEQKPQTPMTSTNKRLSGDHVVSPQSTSVNNAGRRVRVQTVRAWVPSDTKLSVQAMWWGYRLYLPPPVLAILSDKTLEAAKRAAMITTALTWFFNNLPITALPPAVRPALLLLQRLAPFLGYIGTFISWSWGTIKSYDVGMSTSPYDGRIQMILRSRFWGHVDGDLDTSHCAYTWDMA
ncbi:hypothetical protein B0H34DRAFT_182774 [Crassisporium funariophilum]|nr:hypothetical protein B0H34DRAFT_182774 [Crassisporium funariophilum]